MSTGPNIIRATNGEPPLYTNLEVGAIPEDAAIAVIAKATGLNTDQTTFFTAAIKAANPDHPSVGPTFHYGGKPFTPKSWVQDKLKFSQDQYYVITFPNSERGRDGLDVFSKDYWRSLQILKKALLYGYSLPVSFNFLDNARAERGLLSCDAPGCADAGVASAATNPHANHAVLLIDYRTQVRDSIPTTVAALQQSFKETPSAWVIKNSWGFNNNTSKDPQLLRRFPLPAFTIMSQDFFEASHKKMPLRYEAIVPRQVCLRRLPDRYLWHCDPLITATESRGVPQVDVTLEEPQLILNNFNQAASWRQPVEFNDLVQELADPNPVIELLDPLPGTQAGAVDLIGLTSHTRVEDPSKGSFLLCAHVKPDPRLVRYVALYTKNAETGLVSNIPHAILSEQGNWQYCHAIASTAQKFEVILQTINARYEVTHQLKTTVEVSP